MIHKFTARNFYSFKDTIKINFDVNEKAPETTSYVKNLGQRTSKVLTVIGPNASGKTNLLKILPFLRFFIVASFNLKPNERIPYEQYRFTDKHDNVTELSVTFSLNSMLYEYSLKLDLSQVLNEKLRKYNKKTKQFSILFSRKWNVSKNDYDYDLKNFIISTKVKTIVTKRKNASLLSIAAQIEHKLSKEIITFWDSIEFNVDMLGKHEHPEMLDLNEASQYYYEHPEAKTLAEALLTRFDLGLSKLKIETHTHKIKTGKEETYYVPIGLHKGETGNYPLSFLYESGGTKCLFTLLRKIIPVLSTGSIAVLDGFDADLHPHMLPELIDLFMSEELNPKNAQLIFSTHHHEILNKLDKYQIIVIEKNEENGVSEVWRLDDLGVRVDDNYYAKYIAGAYGGVPDL